MQIVPTIYPDPFGMENVLASQPDVPGIDEL